MQSVAAVCPQFHSEDLNLDTSTPLGAGAISYVVKSTLRGPSQLPIVVKIVSKLQVLQQNKVSSVINEKVALIALQPHPFIGRLYGTSQSEDELYFVMESLPHGDLLQHIRRSAAERVQSYTAHALLQGTEHPPNEKTSASMPLHACKEKATKYTRTPENKTHVDYKNNNLTPLQPIPASSHALRCLDFHDIQLITAQLILALAHVASKKFVLRDLKPENVVFDDKYRACLIDFDTVDLEGEQNTPQTNHGNALPERITLATHKNTTIKEKESSQTSEAHSSSLSSITKQKECCPIKENEEIEKKVNSLSQEQEKVEYREEIENKCEMQSNGTVNSSNNAGDISDMEKKESHASCTRRRITVSQIQEMRRRTASFCGTAQYVSPEMVGECKWSFSSDLWALGAMVYEMMYGVHLFTGSSTFYVLQKVIKGLGPVAALDIPFPYIDFTREDSTTRPCDKNNGSSGRVEKQQNKSSNNNHNTENNMFVRVKDFIIKVMHIDPRKRLGVNAETNSFDLHALQSHMLFDNFDWDILEIHIRDYKARTFHDESALSSSSSSSSLVAEAVVSKVNSDNNNIDATCQCVDTTPSLRDFYHKLPRNDDKYAEYVARATADANPFERFMNMICMTDATDAMESEEESTNGNSGQDNCKNNSHTNKRNDKGYEEEEHDNIQASNNIDTHSDTSEMSCSDESDVEVIDDLGVRYTGHQAPEDFQQSESCFDLQLP